MQSMKTILTIALLAASFASSAWDHDCSPYPTETTSLIESARSCEEAARIAIRCSNGGRSDAMLAYSGIVTCEALKGKLTPSQERTRATGNRVCSKTHGSDHDKALYCMLAVIRDL